MVIGRKFLGSKGLPLFLYIGLILPISQISGKKPVSKIKLIKNLKTSDPKEYWKILNRGREKKQPDIPMEDLFNFF
jgi:hypothetical protein